MLQHVQTRRLNLDKKKCRLSEISSTINDILLNFNLQLYQYYHSSIKISKINISRIKMWKNVLIFLDRYVYAPYVFWDVMICISMFSRYNFLFPEHTRVLVPESCCIKDQYGVYLGLEMCQKNRKGPPQQQQSEDKTASAVYDLVHTIYNILINNAL